MDSLEVAAGLYTQYSQFLSPLALSKNGHVMVTSPDYAAHRFPL